MNLDRIRAIVGAVLYEGYILYPYRATSAKNRQRWTFGGVYPHAWCEASGSDTAAMQTQCLVEGGAGTRVEVHVRFLQPVAREIGVLDTLVREWCEDTAYTRVPQVRIGDKLLVSWQEALERDIALPVIELDAPRGRRAWSHPFHFDAARELEPLAESDGSIRGVFERTRMALDGCVELTIERLAEGLHRLTVRIENLTEVDAASLAHRNEASLYSFASTHTVLGVSDGAFVSLTDPPPALTTHAKACKNQGTWPVLVGPEGARDALLSSPIILSDYPQVAPESPGDMYDATEIDELLSLTVLAMPDDEKREMAALDPRASALLQRLETMSGDDFLRLHGTMRDDSGTRDSGLGARNSELHVGDRVRLHPAGNGDAMDILLDGRAAVVEGIERDLEDRVHVAVTIEDDPGREWGIQRMPGHRFFFSPAEMEPLAPAAGEPS